MAIKRRNNSIETIALTFLDFYWPIRRNNSIEFLLGKFIIWSYGRQLIKIKCIEITLSFDKKKSLYPLQNLRLSNFK